MAAAADAKQNQLYDQQKGVNIIFSSYIFDRVFSHCKYKLLMLCENGHSFAYNIKKMNTTPKTEQLLLSDRKESSYVSPYRRSKNYMAGPWARGSRLQLSWGSWTESTAKMMFKIKIHYNSMCTEKKHSFSLIAPAKQETNIYKQAL